MANLPADYQLQYKSSKYMYKLDVFLKCWYDRCLVQQYTASIMMIEYFNILNQNKHYLRYHHLHACKYFSNYFHILYTMEPSKLLYFQAVVYGVFILLEVFQVFSHLPLSNEVAHTYWN